MVVIELSNVSDEELTLVLLRVSGVDLLKNCAQVSKQWNRIINDRSFWEKFSLDVNRKKCVNKWYRLDQLSIQTIQTVALRNPFGRNFIKDSWDLQRQDESCWVRDERWKLNQRITRNVRTLPELHHWEKTAIEVPPQFAGHPALDAEIGELPEACLATSTDNFIKRITIRLSDEGLTEELMDKFGPTILISELVANRLECGSIYKMRCQLSKEISTKTVREDAPNQEIARQFDQWEVEGWHRVEVERNCKEYPAGNRFLIVASGGRQNEWRAPQHALDPLNFGHFGVKLANCKVEALCENSVADLDNPNLSEWQKFFLGGPFPKPNVSSAEQSALTKEMVERTIEAMMANIENSL